MKSRSWIAFAAAAALPAAAQAADVSVAVEGVRAGGRLHVSLQQREQFLSDDQVDAKVIDNPSAGTVTVTFAGVQPGDYSVNVWHDDNGNGELDWGPGGSPLDGWALVNGKSLTAMPTFDQVKTTVSDEGAAVQLPMIYARSEAGSAD